MYDTDFTKLGLIYINHCDKTHDQVLYSFLQTLVNENWFLFHFGHTKQCEGYHRHNNLINAFCRNCGNLVSVSGSNNFIFTKCPGDNSIKVCLRNSRSALQIFLRQCHFGCAASCNRRHDSSDKGHFNRINHSGTIRSSCERVALAIPRWYGTRLVFWFGAIVTNDVKATGDCNTDEYRM